MGEYDTLIRGGSVMSFSGVVEQDVGYAGLFGRTRSFETNGPAREARLPAGSPSGIDESGGTLKET